MAVAAFKSTSRRATNPHPHSISSDKETTRDRLPTSPKKPKPPPRRSRSVSAVSRSHLDNPSTSASSSTSDFLLTTRDNPLYWTTTSPRDEDSNDKDGVSGTVATKSSELDVSSRGRSASRNVSNRKEIGGRSLSRIDTDRRNRSVSRGPVSRGNSINSESELEQEGSTRLLRKQTPRNSLSGSSVGRSSVGGNDTDRFNSRARLGGSAKNLSPLPIASWEDGTVGSNSYSEAEEKTIKAVCEQMKSFEGDNLGSDTSSRIYETVRSEVRRAIADIQNDLESAMRRSNVAAIATTSVTDIPPDLVNPSAVELVLDIRREYASKLEESLERGRKLRADLAVEEHRGLELSRILKEVLPDPKTPSVQKSRPVKKASIERRRMSRRLTEEAMAYFDECVSLSTFDSSDFSSQEDPPINIVGSDTPFSDHGSHSQASDSTRANHRQNSSYNYKQESGSAYNHYASGLSAASSSKNRPVDEARLNSTETQQSPRLRFSFSHKPDDTLELQQDIMKYVQNIEKNDDYVPANSECLRSNDYHLNEFNLQPSSQKLLIDMVVLKNRTESGGMLLCRGGGLPISLSPFSSLL